MREKAHGVYLDGKRNDHVTLDLFGFVNDIITHTRLNCPYRLLAIPGLEVLLESSAKQVQIDAGALRSQLELVLIVRYLPPDFWWPENAWDKQATASTNLQLGYSAIRFGSWT